MFSKSIVAALIVLATAVSLSTTSSAGPIADQTGGEAFYMHRASQNHDNGGN